MLVYRLETDDGTGAFLAGAGCGTHFENKSLSDMTPPNRDGKLRDIWKEMMFNGSAHTPYFFAFSTIMQFHKTTGAGLRNKLYAWRSSLGKQKLYLSVYNVAKENVIDGDTQCVFLKANATLLAMFMLNARLVDIAQVKEC